MNQVWYEVWTGARYKNEHGPMPIQILCKHSSQWSLPSICFQIRTVILEKVRSLAPNKVALWRQWHGEDKNFFSRLFWLMTFLFLLPLIYTVLGSVIVAIKTAKSCNHSMKIKARDERVCPITPSSSDRSCFQNCHYQVFFSVWMPLLFQYWLDLFYAGHPITHIRYILTFTSTYLYKP